MYVLTKFGTSFDLPDKLPSEDVGSGNYRTSFYDLPGGGAYDALGTSESTPGKREYTKRAIFAEGSQALNIAYYRRLLGLVGKRDKLYRTWDDGTVEWVRARLTSINAGRIIENKNFLECELQFDVFSPYWRGKLVGSWDFDAGEYFDAGLYFDSENVTTLNTSPKTITVTNDGNAAVTDVVITLTAGSASITAATIVTSDAALEYSATIAAGESLVIDCGAYSVENDGSDDYANFALGSGHAINEWFRLPSGDTVVTVTITGGSTDSEIEISFYEAHK